MSRRQLAGITLLVLGLTAGTAGAEPSPGPPPSTNAPPVQLDRPASVTLPTGDQVLTTPAGPLLRPGQERTTMAGYRVDGRHYLVPRDAALPAGPGALVDPAAFEVTGPRTPAPRPPTPVAADHQVTLRFLDRAGQPATRAEAMLVGLDTGEYWFVDGAGGTADLTLPAGRYALSGTVYTPGPTTSAALLVQPRLTVEANAEVALDARDAKPIEVRVPHASARPAAVVVWTRQHYHVGDEPRSAGALLTTRDADTLLTGHLGPEVPAEEFRSVVKVNLAEPGPTGDFQDSPYLYSLRWRTDGRMWTGLSRQLSDHRDLATVRAEYATPPGRQLASTAAFARDADDGYDAAMSVPISLPHTRTEYYSTNGTRWSSVLCHAPADHPGAEFTTCLSQPDEIAYLPGHTYRQRWNSGPILLGARRTDRLTDALRVLPSVTDQAGNSGGLPLAAVTKDRLALYREGVLVGETGLDYPVFTGLPPEPARYRLELTASVGAPLPARRFAAAWTFTSASDIEQVPIATVRLVPNLDENNRSPAGRPILVPIRVDRADPAAELTAVTVDVSYDDGATWRRSPVSATADGWLTVFRPPVDATGVSVRASTADTAGNTSAQTVIRAWELS